MATLVKVIGVVHGCYKNVYYRPPQEIAPGQLEVLFECNSMGHVPREDKDELFLKLKGLGIKCAYDAEIVFKLTCSTEEFEAAQSQRLISPA